MRLIGNTEALVLAMYLATGPGVSFWLIAMGLAVVISVANSRVTRPQPSTS
jgi:type IV secretory pathway TrbD component